jgi:calcium-dependent protein kinase
MATTRAKAARHPSCLLGGHTDYSLSSSSERARRVRRGSSSASARQKNNNRVREARRRRGVEAWRTKYAKYEDVRRGRDRRDENEGKRPSSSSSSSSWLEPSPRRDANRKDVVAAKTKTKRRVEDFYTVGDVIGSGGYGVVREVVCKETGKKLALKSIKKKPRNFTGKLSLYKLKVQAEFKSHLSLGKSLDIVYAYESFEDAESVHLVLELCSGGSLLSLSPFLCRGEYSEKQVASALRAALRSIIQCNEHGVVFRDIKPENFLWTEQGHLKLSDFGMAAFCNEEEGETLSERCGTVSFLAPEVIKQKYGQSCDVWSVGVLAYFLLSGTYPFKDEENQTLVTKEIWRAVLYEEPNFEGGPWPRLSEECKDFVRRLLEKDPGKRITAKEALDHEWVREEREGGVANDEVLEESLVARLQRFGLYGKLKQALLQKTLKYLDPKNEEVEKVNQFLSSLDYQGTGMVRVDDIVWMLSSGGYDLEADEWVQICDKIDTDGKDMLDVMDLAPFLVDWPKVQREEAWEESVKGIYNALCSSEILILEDLVKLVCDSEDEGCSLEIIDEIVKYLGSSEDPIELEKFSQLLRLRDSELLSYYDSRVEYYEELSQTK